jgi:hypothetical protein
VCLLKRHTVYYIFNELLLRQEHMPEGIGVMNTCSNIDSSVHSLMLIRKTILLCCIAASTLLLVQCSPKTGKSTAASTSTAKTTGPQYTEAQVTEGHAIYTANCGKCHKLVNPADKSLDKWNAVLPPMIKKAHLSDEQGNLVRAYVMANIKK